MTLNNLLTEIYVLAQENRMLLDERQKTPERMRDMVCNRLSVQPLFRTLASQGIGPFAHETENAWFVLNQLAKWSVDLQDVSSVERNQFVYASLLEAIPEVSLTPDEAYALDRYKFFLSFIEKTLKEICNEDSLYVLTPEGVDTTFLLYWIMGAWYAKNLWLLNHLKLPSAPEQVLILDLSQYAAIGFSEGVFKAEIKNSAQDEQFVTSGWDLVLIQGLSVEVAENPVFAEALMQLIWHLSHKKIKYCIFGDVHQNFMKLTANTPISTSPFDRFDFTAQCAENKVSENWSKVLLDKLGQMPVLGTL